MTNQTDRLNQELLELDALIASLIEVGELDTDINPSEEAVELGSLFKQADSIMNKEIYN